MKRNGINYDYSAVIVLDKMNMNGLKLVNPVLDQTNSNKLEAC